MASGSKKKKNSYTPPPPKTSYPVAPHIVGMDWLELPSTDPAAAATMFVMMGFTPRPHQGSTPVVATGGLVIMFKRTTQPAADRLSLTLQLTTDNITLKRQQLMAMNLKPGVIRRQPRGDMAFTWRSDEGYAVRFVGPLRD